MWLVLLRTWSLDLSTKRRMWPVAGMLDSTGPETQLDRAKEHEGHGQFVWGLGKCLIWTREGLE